MKTNALVMLSVLALASCSNDKDADELKRPIADNLVGTWQHSDCLKQNDQGIWESIDIPGKTYSYTYTFTPDGKVTTTRTTPEGWQQMQCGTWEANENESSYTATYRGEPYTFPIFRLTNSEFVYVIDTLNDDESEGVEISGPFHLIYHRTANIPVVQKTAGTWSLGKRFEKVNGDWKEAAQVEAEEAWLELNSSGSATVHGKSVDKTKDLNGGWMFNVRNPQLRIATEDGNIDITVNMVDDNTMEFLYTATSIPLFGNALSAEYKDVMVREP